MEIETIDLSKVRHFSVLSSNGLLMVNYYVKQPLQYSTQEIHDLMVEKGFKRRQASEVQEEEASEGRELLEADSN